MIIPHNHRTLIDKNQDDVERNHNELVEDKNMTEVVVEA
jgi:hypothetical protein